MGADNTRPHSAQQQALREAHARWEAQAISGYRLRLEYAHIIGLPLPPPCQQEVTVTDAQGVTALVNECSLPPLTVDDLFHEAAAFLHHEETSHAPHPLVPPWCHARHQVTLAFHPDRGYPVLVERQVMAHPTWGHPTAWEVWWKSGHPPVCTAGIGGTRTPVTRYRVRDLTPHP